MSECSCSIAFAPCETHRATLESGEETVNITVRFDDKYSRFAGNAHRVNLERVQRIHLGVDSEPMEFSESTLATMLQDMADERPFETEAFVLRAVANALRGEDDHHKLVLRQRKRGAWKSPADDLVRHRQQVAWILRLGRLEAQGWQTDAAVHRIAETTGKSVSRVYAGIAEERHWQRELRAMSSLMRKQKRNRSTPKTIV